MAEYRTPTDQSACSIPPPCPLCLATETEAWVRGAARAFHRCPRCSLVFVARDEHVSLEQERRRYSLHTNNLGDRGYVRYLGGVGDQLERWAPRPDARFLDFGAGPNGVLAVLLTKRGHVCDAYDPLYALGEDCLSKRYDVIAACEVIEHLRDPRATARLIGDLLAPEGRALIWTKFRPERSTFPSWWYAQDKTHIAFWSSRSLQRFAELAGGFVEDGDERNWAVIRRV